MTRSVRVFGMLAALMAMLVSVVVSPVPAAQTDGTPGAVDLAAVKAYVVDQSTTMKEGSSALREVTETYFGIIEAANFDYAAAWAANGEQLTTLMADAKEHWLLASGHYELNEGLIAGVPSLSYYDTWLDAGPSGTEDPEGRSTGPDPAGRPGAWRNPATSST